MSHPCMWSVATAPPLSGGGLHWSALPSVFLPRSLTKARQRGREKHHSRVARDSLERRMSPEIAAAPSLGCQTAACPALWRIKAPVSAAAPKRGRRRRIYHSPPRSERWPLRRNAPPRASSRRSLEFPAFGDKVHEHSSAQGVRLNLTSLDRDQGWAPDSARASHQAVPTEADIATG